MVTYTITEEEMQLLEWANIALRPSGNLQEEAEGRRVVEQVVRQIRRRGKR